MRNSMGMRGQNYERLKEMPLPLPLLLLLPSRVTSLTQDSVHKEMLFTIDSQIREAQSVRFTPLAKGKLALAI